MPILPTMRKERSDRKILCRDGRDRCPCADKVISINPSVIKFLGKSGISIVFSGSIGGVKFCCCRKCRE